ncbi:hypothetical protein O181_007284 [Austropuccinia psidii MF-1]|uniref:Uncharacterized protein n=1 Tax=Austropuccinia psidii MF-1 TaxID=1389203 RepID=A0A9Q3BLM9_9BASI|nr:hypothetical protein [Austropuccinia psidii MF-1]
MPIQELVQKSQRGVVGNMSKHFAGGHELLLTHQELSGSGEDHRTLRRMEPIFFQRQDKKDIELVAEPKSFIHRPGVGNDPIFGERRPTGIYQLQNSPRRPNRPQKKNGPKNHQGKGKGKANWHRPNPQG